jgi:hypothetical protein
VENETPKDSKDFAIVDQIQIRRNGFLTEKLTAKRFALRQPSHLACVLVVAAFIWVSLRAADRRVRFVATKNTFAASIRS